MFREMRRNKQALSQEKCAEILWRGTSGVLSLSGDDGYPYGVPISYAYDGEKLYFHCAQAGHKLDAIRRNGKASFCVIAQDQVIPEPYTTHYRSVIVFGTVRILEEEEQYAAMEQLASKYAPDSSAEDRQRAIRGGWNALCVLEMTVAHMTGKEAIELKTKKKKDD